MATLYLVATPIGNLDDFSKRAIEILKNVTLIAAEDTRTSKILLAHFHIRTRQISYHAHNELQSAEKILKALKENHSVALISDAGTPLISDPGSQIVSLAHAHHIRVVPIPGPCALISALVASGLPTGRFSFEGFLPVKSGARYKCLTELKDASKTLIFYEAPHRILETVQDCVVVFKGHRKAAIARELTKLFETIYSGTLAELQTFMEQDKNQLKGEMVLLIGPEVEKDTGLSNEAQKIVEALVKELPVKQTARLSAKITGLPQRLLYEYALSVS